jgi:hypothetical protein
MGWADRAIAELQAGEQTQVRPHGGSMRGKVESGALVTLVPVAVDALDVGDVVLCRVKGNVYLHLVKALQGGRVQIGNNRGGTNGWTRTVFGRATKIEN